MPEQGALPVAAGVEESARNLVLIIAPHLSARRIKHVIADDPELEPVDPRAIILHRETFDIQLPEEDGRISLAVVTEIVRRAEAGVCLRHDDRDSPRAHDVQRTRLEVEHAGNERRVAHLRGLVRWGKQVEACDRPELRSDEEGCPFLRTIFLFTLDVAALRTDMLAKPRRD